MRTLEQIKKEGVVAVLYGGNSAERSVSLESGAAVAASLKGLGYSVELLDTREELLASLLSLQPDFCFIALHGGEGENGSVQGLLELMKLPYSGSGVLGCALAMDKVRSKRIWQSLGLSTPDFRVLGKSDAYSANELLSELGGQVFVKPATEGSSYGMAKVDNADQLSAAIANAGRYANDILLEQFVAGPEYTVAILGDRCLPSIAISTKRDFYDFFAKYEDDETRFDVPSGLSASDEEQLQNLAKSAFDALSCRAWGRVDVMRNAQTDQFMLLEVNTVPGMTSHSLVPMAAKAAGLNFPELLENIVMLSMERSR